MFSGSLAVIESTKKKNKETPSYKTNLHLINVFCSFYYIQKVYIIYKETKTKRDWVLNVWSTFEDFSGFDLHLRSMINVIPLVLCQRLWEKFNPDLCHFQILLYNFVYNVKAYIKLSGKQTSWILANLVWTIRNILNNF